MKKARMKAILIGLAVLLAVGAFSVYAATSYGSEEDPLITKSYLDGVVKAELEKTLREELETAIGEARSSTEGFTLVTLSAGQRVTGGVGTEVLLRFGSASAYAYSSGDTALVDTTAASALNGGDTLLANHLYMVTIEGNGFTAGSSDTKVLIHGSYTLN
ncbi:MAG: hypothetical protein IJ705_08770 [Oscillospiraceae bacterium]|nr:hypothetical protein [Oscillospiraceae bacterium]